MGRFLWKNSTWGLRYCQWAPFHVLIFCICHDPCPWCFFWRMFEFFQDFDLAAHFLAFLSKKLSPGEILMLFRKLTYWSSLKSQFKASVSCKRSTFWSFYQENRRKMQKWRKNPAHAIFRIANVTDTLDRFECISLGFSISWIHNLSEYTFRLHRNYLYSHWEWLFLREFEKILRRKVRF